MADVAVLERPPTKQQVWERESQEAVRQVSELLKREATKAVLVRGVGQSGKTSLSIAVTRELKETSQGTNTQIFFTTPSVHEAYVTTSYVDRTGITYKQLPTAEEIGNFDGTVIIVIDEISKRGPVSQETWQRYISLPNTKFLLLSHLPAPHNQRYIEEWFSLFPPDKIQTYNL